MPFSAACLRPAAVFRLRRAGYRYLPPQRSRRLDPAVNGIINRANAHRSGTGGEARYYHSGLTPIRPCHKHKVLYGSGVISANNAAHRFRQRCRGKIYEP